MPPPRPPGGGGGRPRPKGFLECLKIRQTALAALLCLWSLHSFSQGEANNWLYGKDRAGITFTNGQPQNLNYPTSLNTNSSTVVSDSVGNLLFYSNGLAVYNKQFQLMENGNGILCGHYFQSCIAFPKPGSSRYYYLVAVGDDPLTPSSNYGGWYSIIDIEANSGLGKVIVKNIMLDFGEDAMIDLTATYHKNNKDIWLITENQDLNHLFFKVYLVTNNGIFYKYRYSQNKNAYTGTNGPTQLRVSPDGMKLIKASDGLGGITGFIYSFNNETGNITKLFGINFLPIQPFGAEFSPSSEYVYLSGPATTTQYWHKNLIAQYNANLTDSVAFNNSMVIVGEFPFNNHPYGMMQCAPDGKIYGARSYIDTLFVINEPDLPGSQCEVNEDGYASNGDAYFNLPQFLTAYAQRFYFTGTCAKEPYQFTSHFFPEPASLLWDFGDGNTSTELNPVHQYAEGGEYTVHVSVVFPNGSTGEATRKVKVAGLPESALPEEIIVCKGEQVTLDAGLFASYAWSTGASDTLQSVIVSDTGYYWVEIANDTGCMARDSVHVKWFAQPQLNELPVISPTTCGSSIGAITGINITGGSPPYNTFWLNSQGDTIATSNDIYNLGVDNYFLWVTDQNGCSTLLASCAIQNFDSYLIITGVTPQDTWCNQPLGALDVQVQSGLSDRLLYSIDNWTTSQTTGQFTNLSPGSYYVKAKDSLGCEAVFIKNPVIISNLPGLSVLDVVIGHETDNNANGSIAVVASGDTLGYSINGSVPQSDSLFTGLVKGLYTITVTDIHGCDSTFTIEIERITGLMLTATAGDTMVCKGLRASEPLMVRNFKDITSFEITLSYNNQLLDAIGYINANSAIISGLEPVNYPTTGSIALKWTGTTPLTLDDNTILMDIVMQGKNQGLSSVDWVLTNHETSFTNRYGVSVPVIPEMGSVKVAPNPEIVGFYQEKVCEFSTMSQMAMPMGGTGTTNITWETPKGVSTAAFYNIDSASMEDAGIYRITAIDEMNCMSKDSIEVTVIPVPVTNFPESPILYENQYKLEVPQGYASYEWSTGDSIYYITVTEEGEYSVIIQTEEGCESRDTAMMVNVAVPIQVPNAFTPNNDGLNDTFKPIITKPDLVVQYQLSIYNRWGECFFETSDPARGWDGKDEMAGVYNWVVSYSNKIGKGYQLKGVVTLIK